MTTTHLDVALRWVGIHERPGGADHPLIVWMLTTVGQSPDVHDEVPWCSAAVGGLAHLFGVLPPTVTAAARSWLTAGVDIELRMADTDYFDVVVLKRGPAPQPGPLVLHAQGHVGIYLGMDGPDHIRLWSGNMGNAITMHSFPVADLLGVRRIG